MCRVRGRPEFFRLAESGDRHERVDADVILFEFSDADSRHAEDICFGRIVIYETDWKRGDMLGLRSDTTVPSLVTDPSSTVWFPHQM